MKCVVVPPRILSKEGDSYVTIYHVQTCIPDALEVGDHKPRRWVRGEDGEPSDAIATVQLRNTEHRLNQENQSGFVAR
jgi:hypothetical protein